MQRKYMAINMCATHLKTLEFIQVIHGCVVGVYSILNSCPRVLTPIKIKFIIHEAPRLGGRVCPLYNGFSNGLSHNPDLSKRTIS